jgi:uncharacterized membrane protein
MMSMSFVRKTLVIGVTVLGCGAVVLAQKADEGAVLKNTHTQVTRGNALREAAQASEELLNASLDLDYLPLWPYIGVFVVGVCAAGSVRQLRRETEWRRLKAPVQRAAASGVEWPSQAYTREP